MPKTTPTDDFTVLLIRSLQTVAQQSALLGVSQGQNEGVGRVVVLPRGSSDQSTSSLTLVIGEVQLLVVAGLKSPFLC